MMNAVEVSYASFKRIRVRWPCVGKVHKSRYYRHFASAAGCAAGMAIGLKLPIDDKTELLTPENWAALVEAIRATD
ncbi:hypothetical protein [Allopontixanthobacter sediminis]|uniref:Uncharacterized protein n=1 Tax=Allopontixanthobacter sediminis TaxID=1689985 RepID=A0A845AZN5_9SPHN|nr:hypothetical protein [Allopontixanthobacter sediminis]MXP43690.1 hypothetical protein [Allopontixanthobacter sediminis]